MEMSLKDRSFILGKITIAYYIIAIISFRGSIVDCYVYTRHRSR